MTLDKPERQRLKTLANEGEVTMELNEVAAKAPESLPEKEDERLLRERAEWFYRHSNPAPGLSTYAAGWIAAKAHYETKQ